MHDIIIEIGMTTSIGCKDRSHSPRVLSESSIGLLIAVVVGVAVLAASASASRETVPARWKNCTVVNKLYPHGVGKLHAHDKTTGTPVTNFWRSTVLYLAGMQINRGLDRDKDGIACEKH